MWTFYDHLGQQLSSGQAGADGQSAYQVWLDAGNTGSVEDYLLSLIGPGVPNGGDAGTVLAKASSANQDTTWVNLDDRYAPITERRELTQTFEIPAGQEAEVSLPLARIFGLLAVESSEPCRVRIFNSEADRSADTSRGVLEVPAASGGLVCDVLLTSDLLSCKLSPPQLGSYQDTGAAQRMIPALIRNDGTGSSVQLNFTWWPIEFFYQAPVVVSDPVLTGSPTEGSTILISGGGWDGYPEPVIAYKWQRSADNSTWSDIAGETALSYQLTAADVGQYVRVAFTATNSLGSGSDSTTSLGPIV